MRIYSAKGYLFRKRVTDFKDVDLKYITRTYSGKYIN